MLSQFRQRGRRREGGDLRPRSSPTTRWECVASKHQTFCDSARSLARPPTPNHRPSCVSMTFPSQCGRSREKSRAGGPARPRRDGRCLPDRGGQIGHRRARSDRESAAGSPEQPIASRAPARHHALAALLQNAEAPARRLTEFSFQTTGLREAESATPVRPRRRVNTPGRRAARARGEAAPRKRAPRRRERRPPGNGRGRARTRSSRTPAS